MEFVALVVSLLLVQYFVFALLVGKARIRNNIAAPAVTGSEDFERYYRVQQNTLEQLLIVVPSMFIFAQYISPETSAILGSLFFIGRVLYAKSYVSDPKSRSAGFIIGFLATLVLLLGGAIGAVMAMM